MAAINAYIHYLLVTVSSVAGGFAAVIVASTLRTDARPREVLYPDVFHLRRDTYLFLVLESLLFFGFFLLTVAGYTEIKLLFTGSLVPALLSVIVLAVLLFRWVIRAI